MKIFVSWSKRFSGEIASMLKQWLEPVLPGVDIWLSSEDIDKGSVWFGEIIDGLSQSDCGIICLTKENILSPWLHFEAGAMIKGLTKRKICTIMFNVPPQDIQQPLNQFQGTIPDREGMRGIVHAFNKAREAPLKPHVLEKTFDRFWPDFERDYAAILAHHGFKDIFKNAPSEDLTPSDPSELHTISEHANAAHSQSPSHLEEAAKPGPSPARNKSASYKHSNDSPQMLFDFPTIASLSGQARRPDNR